MDCYPRYATVDYFRDPCLQLQSNATEFILSNVKALYLLQQMVCMIKMCGTICLF